MLCSKLIEDDEESMKNGNPPGNGIITLLRGTDDWWVLLIADFGYAFLSHHYRKLNLRTLQIILKEFGGLMLTTRSADKPPQLLQVGPDGKFVIVEATEEMIGADVKMLNSSAVATLCRHGIE